MAYEDKKVSIEMSKLKCRGFVSMAGVFEKFRAVATDAADKKVYGILHDVCMLSYYDGDAPYGPFFLPAGAVPSFSVSTDPSQILNG